MNDKNKYLPETQPMFPNQALSAKSIGMRQCLVIVNFFEYFGA